MKKAIDPAMHSTEHILNQAMGRCFGSDRCFSAHLEKKKSKCDYRFDRLLNAEELSVLEMEVNRVIAADLPITESFLPRAAAKARFNLSRLPDDAGDAVRIVSVGDYDHCPCIGPHVATTAEIGRCRITTASFADGVMRIRFKLDRQRH